MKYGLLGVLGLFICLVTSSVQAQRGSYFGIGAAYSTAFGIVSNIGLFPSFQVGGPISEALELRGTLESIVSTSNLGLDLLYPIGLKGTDARLYLGGGANSRFFFYLPVSFELHLVLGGEYFFNSGADLSPLGLFGEARIYSSGLFYGFPTLEGRVGVNLPL